MNGGGMEHFLLPYQAYHRCAMCSMKLHQQIETDASASLQRPSSVSGKQYAAIQGTSFNTLHHRKMDWALHACMHE